MLACQGQRNMCPQHEAPHTDAMSGAQSPEVHCQPKLPSEVHSAVLYYIHCDISHDTLEIKKCHEKCAHLHCSSNRFEALRVDHALHLMQAY